MFDASVNTNRGLEDTTQEQKFDDFLTRYFAAKNKKAAAASKPETPVSMGPTDSLDVIESPSRSLALKPKMTLGIDPKPEVATTIDISKLRNTIDISKFRNTREKSTQMKGISVKGVGCQTTEMVSSAVEPKVAESRAVAPNLTEQQQALRQAENKSWQGLAGLKESVVGDTGLKGGFSALGKGRIGEGFSNIIRSLVMSPIKLGTVILDAPRKAGDTAAQAGQDWVKAGEDRGGVVGAFQGFGGGLVQVLGGAGRFTKPLIGLSCLVAGGPAGWVAGSILVGFFLFKEIGFIVNDKIDETQSVKALRDVASGVGAMVGSILSPIGQGIYKLTQKKAPVLLEKQSQTTDVWTKPVISGPKETSNPKAIQLDGKIAWRSVVPHFEELLKWEGQGTGLTPRNIQLALKRHLANPNAERFETLQEFLNSATNVCEEIRQLKHCSSPGGYLAQALEDGPVAPPSLGFQSRRKQAEAKTDKSEQPKSPQKTPLERVQRMTNMELNDFLGKDGYFLPVAVKRKMAMEHLQSSL